MSFDFSTQQADRSFTSGEVEITYVVAQFDSGYVVAKGREVAKKGASVFALVGTFGAHVSRGDTFHVTGTWGDHVRYGPQFRVDSAVRVEARTEHGLQMWMVEQLPQIGESRARQAVKHFGVEGLITVLETDPQKLTVIKGITKERAETLGKAAQKAAAQREQDMWFYEHGLNAKQMAAARRRWKSEAQQMLELNPYQLMELPAVTFRIADPIALKFFDIVPDDTRRVFALLWETVNGVCNQTGSTWVSRSTVILNASNQLKLGFRVVDTMIDDVAQPYIVTEPHHLAPADLDNAENIIAEAVAIRLRG